MCWTGPKVAARMALLVAKHQGTSTEDLLHHCGYAKWATLSKDCAMLHGKSGCILAPFGFIWTSSIRKRSEIWNCMGVLCKWTVMSLVPTPWAFTSVHISGLEVAKRFQNPQNLGILWHSIRFLAIRFRAF